MGSAGSGCEEANPCSISVSGNMPRMLPPTLRLPAAQQPNTSLSLSCMVALAGERPSALLCFEREPAQCHRTLLLDAVAPNAEVVHLFA